MSARAKPALLRSEIMSRIPGRDTSPEMALRSLLWASGHRYRLHQRVGRWRPDLLFHKQRVVVFVDGCFWHGCPEHYVPPRTSRAFWEAKLKTNVCRDSRQTADLEDRGWRVVRVWEHDLRRDPEAASQQVSRKLRGREVGRRPDLRVIRVDFEDAVGEREARHLVDLLSLKPVRLVRRRRSTRKL